MKITEEIHQVGGQGFTSPEDAAVYLIHFEGRAALVDAGCGRSGEALSRNIEACGVAPDAIEFLLITHCHFDHTGGASALKDKFNCRITAHERDAVFLETGDNVVTAANWYGSTLDPFNVDRKLRDSRETIRLGGRTITAIHAPGHSPGSVVYLILSEGKQVLFAHDVHGPLHPDFLSDEKEYQRSLERLLSLDADILCEGHFGIYRGKDKVRGFIQSFLD